MPACLLDVNVWLAAAFPAHPAHDRSQQVLLDATPGTTDLFCRATQHSFLRVVSTPAIFNAYRSAPITNRDALSALAAFAIRDSLRMTSLDGDFRQFVAAGLDLVLLSVDASEGG